MNKVKNYLRENGLTLAIFLGMVFLYYSIPSQIAENMMAKSAVSPRFFPTFAITCVMICCALLLLIDLGKRILAKRQGKTIPAPAPKDENVSYLRVLIVVALLIAWYLVVEKIGFSISTVILMFSTSYILGCRSKVVLVVFPLVFTLSVYFIFTKLLHVSLPEILF